MQAAENTSLIHSLGLCPGSVVSIFGAGGKTSLMYELARQGVKAGQKVLTTTTTRIFYPHHSQCRTTLIEPDVKDLKQKISAALSQASHITAGSLHDSDTGKVTGFCAEDIGLIYQDKLVDWIIVETDGARMKPFKASSAFEPVFPLATTDLILVAGLDAVGLPVDETHVHRPELIMKHTGLDPGAFLSHKDIAKTLLIEMDKAKTRCSSSTMTYFLNKADTDARFEAGRKIIDHIRKQDTQAGYIIGCLEPECKIKYQAAPSPYKTG